MKFFLSLIIYAVLTLLVLSLLAGRIPPSGCITVALTGLIFPVLWIIALISLVLIIVLRYKVLSFVTLVILILTSPLMFDYFSIGLNKKLQEPEYKILSFNVFGLRIPDSTIQQLENQKYLNSVLNQLDLSVVCLQEYPMKGSRHGKFYDQLINGLEIEHKALSQDDHEEKSTHYSLVTASQYPIINKGLIFYKKEPFAMYTDISFPEKTVRIYNVHLVSVKFTTERKLLLLKDDSLQLSLFSNLKKAVDKLKVAYLDREEQVNILREEIKQSPYPIIIAGDFNDTPASFAYNRLQEEMKDASSYSSPGLKRTFKMSTFPLQIDYILYDESIAMSNYKLYDMTISDHFSISSGFNLNH